MKIVKLILVLPLAVAGFALPALAAGTEEHDPAHLAMHGGGGKSVV